MDGNEIKIKCFKCALEIEGNECYECDCCQEKIHKQCMTLQSSEMRVIPLQKRALLFVCDTCKGILKKMPYIIKMLESIQCEMRDIKNNIKTTEKVIPGFKSFPTYTEVTKGKVQPTNATIKNVPNLIVMPKVQQNADKTRKEIQEKIKPAELKIGVKNTRATKDGGIIIRCETKEETEILQKEAKKILNSKYEIHMTKLRNPKIKIVGCELAMSEKEIEDSIREQNHFIEETDQLNITYIKKQKNKKSTIFAECSPGLFHKFMIQKKCVFYGNAILFMKT